MDWESSVENNTQTIALIPPKHETPPNECTSADVPLLDGADNVPLPNAPVHTSNESLHSGTKPDLHEDAIITTDEAEAAPREDSNLAEESVLRHDFSSDSVPIGTVSSLELRPEEHSPVISHAKGGMELQSDVEMGNNTGMIDSQPPPDLQASSSKHIAPRGPPPALEMTPEEFWDLATPIDASRRLDPQRIEELKKLVPASQDLPSVPPSEPQRSNESLDGPVASLADVSGNIALPETHEANTKENENQDLSTQDALQSQPQQSPPAIPEPKQPAKTPQEITLAELKAQRAALIASLAALPKVKDLISSHESEDESSQASDSEPTEAEVTAAANKLVKAHIKLLHEYNEIKDVGQGLMGLIADQRGVRIVEVQDEFGLDSND
jgi:hypothetical protein